ncbi:tetrahydrofolylpolyglutamate synthase [Sistotremastrum niveocremeum HHB9708]|uniref:Folylpolyglutamate synthase n=1 Tax=Sistotremastrum niveocremeum HHB9708 TaxID=1314777 RepID=A0A164ZJD8_9AGAM|nr:tetrahydrofolylpolyglutamate synthase [Sistotremastrum niveocremeum HHB9708]
MATRTYEEAITKLNTLQSNFATLEAARRVGGVNEYAIAETEEYLARIGYSPSDLNRLNVIHVTGTKGKGSTCAFATSILQQAKPNWNIGLYTSPHLVAVRERIRVNGVPISEEQFTKYFFEVWDRLEANDKRARPTTPPKPMYFKYLTLVAFHAFLSLKVDATILEVGVGGLLDCTNVVPKPIVTGVTALGYDHVAVLGKTLREIAFQKGGIYKPGVPAFSVPQPPEALESVKKQAIDRQASSFTVTPSLPALSSLRLGLAGKHQVQNATLAVYLCHAFLQSVDEDATRPPIEPQLPQDFVKGLENAKWPGRCQKIKDPKHELITWCLDGAHTTESLTCCAEWYINPEVALQDRSATRVLIFNCTNGRTGEEFLSQILATISSQLTLLQEDASAHGVGWFNHVIFCTNVTYADGASKGDLHNNTVDHKNLEQLGTQHALADAWAKLVPEFNRDHIHVLPSIQHTVELVHILVTPATPAQVLVTGSLHLVGGVIEAAGLSEVAL